MSDRDLASLIKDRNGAIWRVPGTQKSVRCTIFEIHGNGIRNVLYNFYDVSEGGGGGGKKQSGRHHPPTLKSSLRASQICYNFLQGGLGKKVMRCQSLGGGGGVYALNEFLKKFITFIIYFFCN